MIKNNPKLELGCEWIMQDRPHDSNYNPVLFKPVIGPPRRLEQNELPQIEEQKEPFLNFVNLNKKKSARALLSGVDQKKPSSIVEEDKENSLKNNRPNLAEKSFQNYGLGLGNSSRNSSNVIDQEEASLIRQINELANDEDCSSSELKRMRLVILGGGASPLSNLSKNDLNHVSQENHLSFANRQYPGMAARLRELKGSK